MPVTLVERLSQYTNILNILKIVPCGTQRPGVCSSVPPDRRGPQAGRAAAWFHLGGWPGWVEVAHCHCETTMFTGLLPRGLYKMTGDCAVCAASHPNVATACEIGGGISLHHHQVCYLRAGQDWLTGWGIMTHIAGDISVIPKIFIAQRDKWLRRLQRNDCAALRQRASLRRWRLHTKPEWACVNCAWRAMTEIRL